MLFSKNISRLLANDLAAKFNGTIQQCSVMFGAFTTCHYKVKFTYKNITVFSNYAYDMDATKTFCQKIENEIDIYDLRLEKGEYLGISNGQMVLQSKNKKFEELSERIDVLVNIFLRTRN